MARKDIRITWPTSRFDPRNVAENSLFGKSERVDFGAVSD
jgi:hypothetical protein